MFAVQSDYDAANAGTGPKIVSVSGEVSPSGMCAREFKFLPVYSTDPEHENKQFWDATPTGELRMNANNAGADFEVGREYYLDFVRAPKQ